MIKKTLFWLIMTTIEGVLKEIARWPMGNGSVDFEFISNGSTIDTPEIDRKLCEILGEPFNDDIFSPWTDFLTNVGVSCYNIENQTMDMDKLYQVFDQIDEKVRYTTNPEEFNARLKSSLLYFLVGTYIFTNLHFYEE